ncbi:MAG: XrtA system polysaccharide deacetylase [Alkalispirochaeta sp.]
MNHSIMSVDLEDWFQVENLKAVIPRESWPEREYRVEQNAETLLEIFRDTGTRATFFCLGWVAERSPDLVRKIQGEGHEIASHGYAHKLVYDQPLKEFRQDVVRAKGLLEEITGEAVLGYRAPSFSITEEALHVLAETGHRYDSSVFPVGGHDRYGKVDLPEAAGIIMEIPPATLRIGGRVFPWGGGGYFRLIPYGVFERGYRRAVAAGTGRMFYLHPWEVDPGQPRVTGIRRSYRFRHYVNLGRTADRLRRLCKVIDFGRADEQLKLR